MKQYIKLLKEIKEKGTYKPAAREGMPGTQSLFGYQFRHDLSKGFPLLTTKPVYWKGIVTELLWFLRGDTNIKYLVDNGVNIWNEDAYNYYKKLCKESSTYIQHISLEEFIGYIRSRKTIEDIKVDYPDSFPDNYKLGDCGYQYGKVWRDFGGVDQIKDLIQGLREAPESRRHIVTAIDPAHKNDLALYWCHALFQFNCRPLTDLERSNYAVEHYYLHRNEIMFPEESEEQTLVEQLDKANVPKYYLDCQLYQRSADVVLGVPFNIASYALLTHILCKMCNMIPGEYIHTFGDVHIYDNHKKAVEEQLQREPIDLPRVKFSDSFDHHLLQWSEGDVWSTGEMLEALEIDWFKLVDYKSLPKLKSKAKLSTGLK